MSRPDDPTDLIHMYNEAKQLRNGYEHSYKMAAAYCLPRQYSSWQNSGPAQLNAPVDPRLAYDTTGARSLPKFRAILTRIMTPPTQRYLKIDLGPRYKSLWKHRAVREWFQAATDQLFATRYEPRSQFVVAQGETYNSLGLYGAGPKFIGWEKPNALRPKGGMLYRAIHMRDMFWLTDDAGRVNRWFRRMWLTAQDFKQKFPDATVPKAIEAELKSGRPSLIRYFEFIHYVCPQSQYDESALNRKRYKWASTYAFVEEATYIGDEEGLSCPGYVTPRMITEAQDVYGYSPAMAAMAALGGASQIKKTMLKMGQKAADPPILAPDDGVLSGKVDLRPAAVNYGAMDMQGRKLVAALETGKFDPSDALLTDERRDIEDNFLVTLFQLVSEREMTATEVLERIAETASLIGPYMERLQVEDQGVTVEAEISYMSEYGVLPPLPPELVEAKAEYEITYTSPMARAMYMEDVGGFARWIEMGINYASNTMDPAPLDYINMEVAYPEVGRVMSVREDWIASEDQVAEKRAARQQQVEMEQAVKAAPAMASVAASAMKTQQPEQVAAQ